MKITIYWAGNFFSELKNLLKGTFLSVEAIYVQVNNEGLLAFVAEQQTGESY